jgi:ribosomal protein S18 acetylase RimI-like enzyme
MDVQYTQGTVSAEDIRVHLTHCNEDFVSPLEKKVDIQEYSAKLFENALTFEAWSGNTLIGLVAAYFNDPCGEAGYITNVSTIKTYMGKGIASALINLSIEYAREHHFKRIILEVEKGNLSAIRLYEKLRFHDFEDKHSTILMKFET